MRERGWPPRRRLWAGGLALVALVIALGVASLAAPAAQAHSATPALPAHALLLRSDPAANAILAAPPSQVRAWFSETVNPDSSRLVVIDPANHEVDTRDSHVSPTDPTELISGLQLLRPGTYVVIWRTQSQVDGHITGSSFIFRVANADGSVPPVPATLPTSATPGAAGYGVGNTALDAPTTIQALFMWLALLFLTFWIGGVIWQTWVAPAAAGDADAAEGARLAVRRFRSLAPYALGGLLLANAGLAAALTVEIAGSPRGLIVPQFWRATLLGGQFGAYWWMRQVVALAALILTFMSPPHASSRIPDKEAGDEVASAEIQPWTREVAATLREVQRLPARLLRGWLALSVTGQIEVALAGLLLFAFAMSGHAAATPPSQRAYAVTVDLLHLFFNAVWLGGLMYISAVLVPAARALPERARALALARGVPAFGALAIVSAAFLSLTGSLNATVRLASASQLITSAYGRILTVKVEIFLVMVAISAYHAFFIRPRLARALEEDAGGADAMPLSAVVGAHGASEASAQARGPAVDAGRETGAERPPSSEAQTLAERMADWLRREALLGAGVLLCVALLGVFAGSLAPTQAAAPVNTAAFIQTHSAGSYQVTLRVAPAAFGSNTFTVSVADAQGKPVRDVAALLLTNSLDMDMGVQSFQLRPAAQPGVFSGTGDLTMAGHWQVTVKILPRGASDYLTTQFTLLVGS
ncbi:MAG TPA: copper resistance protein CopC [Ktedonobacterales bacterium]